MGACGSKGKINTGEVDYSHFEQQRCIGRGGFGKVHAVTKLSDPRKGEYFAIKTLEKDQIIQTNTYAEVHRELNLLKNLNHQVICNGHYAFQDARHLYLVMDLVMGGDMRVHINAERKAKENFAYNDILYFTSHLLVALNFCHDRNILHRDIKPDNILICDGGNLKLTDFGISHKLKAKDAFCTMSSGTLEYMAPEIRKAGHNHTYPSEVYSFGVYLYELMYLNLPKATGDFSKLEADAKTEADPQMKALKAFTLKCVEPLPEDRFQTIFDAQKHETFGDADFTQFGKENFPIKPTYKPDVDRVNVQDHAKQEDLMAAFGGEDEETKPQIEDKFQQRFSGYGWNNVLRRELSRSARSSIVQGIKSLTSSGKSRKTGINYTPESDNIKTNCPNEAPRSFREGRRKSHLGLQA
ncbi:hypothetical protein TrST_g3765 [Triparma strigata]|uniref:non-specific serine/threonine protein kinase n=1 Tax=Triparma strigata TaxID=1606541 RepID=A0A9W7AFC7_9STRA|nr:hypothetical protein TrST_g3765 [Triparma strigata]